MLSVCYCLTVVLYESTLNVKTSILWRGRWRQKSETLSDLRWEQHIFSKKENQDSYAVATSQHRSYFDSAVKNMYIRASPPVTLFDKNGLIAWQKCPKLYHRLGLLTFRSRYFVLDTLYLRWKEWKYGWIACLFLTCSTHWSQLFESLEYSVEPFESNFPQSFWRDTLYSTPSSAQAAHRFRTRRNFNILRV